MSKRSQSAVGILLIILISALTWYHRWSIYDWYQLRSFEPSVEIANLANNAYFTDRGTRLFYAHHPELNNKVEFSKSCPKREQALVLGCYTGNRIYILGVDREELSGIEEVTAAHELLHAVYDRMTSDEKRDIDALLTKELKNVKNARVLALIESYRQQNPSSLLNEVHSILGTEIAKLSPELEKHYAQYFSDRQIIVRLADEYEQVFTELDDLIKDYDRQLTTLRTKIESLRKSVKSDGDQLKSERAELDALLSSGQVSEYNARVGSFNDKVEDYNAEVADLRSTIETYNELVAERNEVAVTQIELVESLDASSFKPIE